MEHLQDSTPAVTIMKPREDEQSGEVNQEQSGNEVILKPHQALNLDISFKDSMIEESKELPSKIMGEKSGAFTPFESDIGIDQK